MSSSEHVPPALRGRHAIQDALDVVLEKRDALRSQKAARVAPNLEQITKILYDATARLAPVTRRLSPSTRRNMQRTFAQCGWDVAKYRLIRTPTPGEVLQVFEIMSRGLESVLKNTPTPTPEELDDLRLCCTRLWNLDVNRATPGLHYQINLQGGKSFYDRRDVARDPLFRGISPELLDRPTYRTFIALLDNYEKRVGIDEVVSEHEMREEEEFLNACMDTPVMKYAHAVLAQKGRLPEDIGGARRFLQDLWFGMYKRSRGATADSSGFEHVFVGELKNGKVTGFHNWLQFWMEERRNALDYKGYVRPKRRQGSTMAPDEQEHLIQLNFAWEGAEKMCSSVLIGVSPEFELALYTMVFLMGTSDKTTVALGPYLVDITCHHYRGPKGADRLGTSFPAVSDMTPEEAATTIQAGVRRMQVQRQGSLQYQQRKEENERMRIAAARIQATARGASFRRGTRS